ncbi:hypothetical protein [Endozoicomonas sp. ONNA1]|uniref:hypothetical protein n=1 Tax=Endozoicomonas sp. ONNA1 TaxID=2828740 RepID=UPI002148F207|nr:hypothetical protein [Endozoicomonas sp. ONNA1]
MKTFKSRVVLKWPEEKLWSTFNQLGQHKLVMDDKTIIARGRATIICWYYWEYHRIYPNVPLLSRHHIGLEKWLSDTHMRLLEKILFDTYDVVRDYNKMSELTKLGYEITNRVYNTSIQSLESYVLSTGLLQFLEIVDDPVVSELNYKMLPNEESIQKTPELIKEHLKRPDTIKGNPLKMIAEANIVNWGQLLQAVTTRGYCMDINHIIFPKPVMNSYFQGLVSLYDSMVESRAGSISQVALSKSIQNSEYLTRKLQILGMYIEDLVIGDCGSKTYIPMAVTEENLVHLEGKNYFDGKGLRVVNKTDTFLVGKTIQLRSPTTCHHRDQYKVCSSCFGELSLSLPKGTNLGYACMTALCEILSQAILSTKHLIKNAVRERASLPSEATRFLVYDHKSQSLYLRPEFAGKDLKILVEAEELPLLENIELLSVINQHTAQKLSRLKKVHFEFTDSRGNTTLTPVRLTMGTSPSTFSPEMLRHIQRRGDQVWELGKSGKYIFNLKEFKAKVPIFNLPTRHSTMMDFMTMVKNYLESSSNGAKLSKYKNEADALKATLELVCSRTSVNIALLEIIILAFMGSGNNLADGSIPPVGEPIRFMPVKNALFLRSAGGQMAYEQHNDYLGRIDSYEGRRPRHPLDALFLT